MLRVRKAFGADLPNSVIFRYPTVRAMASLLVEGSPGYRFSHLVELSKGSDPRRLFCVHPAPGTIVCYRELARQFPAWSVYGLQARGLMRGQVPHASVETMVADYVRDIVKVQPQGPYHLLGWSVGGKIAHEVARQLEGRGERVAILAMVDTDPVFVQRRGLRLPVLSVLVFGLWALLSQGGAVRRNWHVLDITSFWPPDLWRRLRMWVNLVRAVVRYRPPRHSVAAKTVLFQTAACALRQTRLRDKTRSVQRIVRDLTVVPVPGDHLELFSSPQLEVLGAELGKWLDDEAQPVQRLLTPSG